MDAKPPPLRPVVLWVLTRVLALAGLIIVLSATRLIAEERRGDAFAGIALTTVTSTVASAPVLIMSKFVIGMLFTVASCLALALWLLAATRMPTTSAPLERHRHRDEAWEGTLVSNASTRNPRDGTASGRLRSRVGSSNRAPRSARSSGSERRSSSGSMPDPEDGFPVRSESGRRQESCYGCCGWFCCESPAAALVVSPKIRWSVVGAAAVLLSITLTDLATLLGWGSVLVWPMETTGSFSESSGIFARASAQMPLTATGLSLIVTVVIHTEAAGVVFARLAQIGVVGVSIALTATRNSCSTSAGWALCSVSPAYEHLILLLCCVLALLLHVVLPAWLLREVERRPMLCGGYGCERHSPNARSHLLGCFRELFELCRCRCGETTSHRRPAQVGVTTTTEHRSNHHYRDGSAVEHSRGNTKGHETSQRHWLGSRTLACSLARLHIIASRYGTLTVFFLLGNLTEVAITSAGAYELPDTVSSAAEVAANPSLLAQALTFGIIHQTVRTVSVAILLPSALLFVRALDDLREGTKAAQSSESRNQEAFLRWMMHTLRGPAAVITSRLEAVASDLVADMVTAECSALKASAKFRLTHPAAAAASSSGGGSHTASHPQLVGRDGSWGRNSSLLGQTASGSFGFPSTSVTRGSALNMLRTGTTSGPRRIPLPSKPQLSPPRHADAAAFHEQRSASNANTSSVDDSCRSSSSAYGLAQSTLTGTGGTMSIAVSGSEAVNTSSTTSRPLPVMGKLAPVSLSVAGSNRHRAAIAAAGILGSPKLAMVAEPEPERPAGMTHLDLASSADDDDGDHGTHVASRGRSLTADDDDAHRVIIITPNAAEQARHGSQLQASMATSASSSARSSATTVAPPPPGNTFTTTTTAAAATLNGDSESANPSRQDELPSVRGSRMPPTTATGDDHSTATATGHGAAGDSGEELPRSASDLAARTTMAARRGGAQDTPHPDAEDRAVTQQRELERLLRLARRTESLASRWGRLSQAEAQSAYTALGSPDAETHVSVAADSNSWALNTRTRRQSQAGGGLAVVGRWQSRIDALLAVVPADQVPSRNHTADSPGSIAALSSARAEWTSDSTLAVAGQAGMSAADSPALSMQARALAQARSERATRSLMIMLSKLLVQASICPGEDEHSISRLRSLPDMLESVQIASRSMGQMSAIFDRLVDVSKIIGGTLVLRPRWCDAVSLFTSIVERLASIIKEKRVALVFEVNGNVVVDTSASKRSMGIRSASFSSPTMPDAWSSVGLAFRRQETSNNGSSLLSIPGGSATEVRPKPDARQVSSRRLAQDFGGYAAGSAIAMPQGVEESDSTAASQSHAVPDAPKRDHRVNTLRTDLGAEYDADYASATSLTPVAGARPREGDGSGSINGRTAAGGLRPRHIACPALPLVAAVGEAMSRPMGRVEAPPVQWTRQPDKVASRWIQEHKRHGASNLYASSGQLAQRTADSDDAASQAPEGHDLTATGSRRIGPNPSAAAVRPSHSMHMPSLAMRTDPARLLDAMYSTALAALAHAQREATVKISCSVLLESAVAPAVASPAAAALSGRRISPSSSPAHLPGARGGAAHPSSPSSALDQLSAAYALDSAASCGTGAFAFPSEADPRGYNRQQASPSDDAGGETSTASASVSSAAMQPRRSILRLAATSSSHTWNPKAKRLYEPFTHLATGTSTTQSFALGLDLALATAKATATACGGTAGVVPSATAMRASSRSLGQSHHRCEFFLQVPVDCVAWEPPMPAEQQAGFSSSTGCSPEAGQARHILALDEADSIANDVTAAGSARRSPPPEMPDLPSAHSTVQPKAGIEVFAAAHESDDDSSLGKGVVQSPGVASTIPSLPNSRAESLMHPGLYSVDSFASPIGIDTLALRSGNPTGSGAFVTRRLSTTKEVEEELQVNTSPESAGSQSRGIPHSHQQPDDKPSESEDAGPQLSLSPPQPRRHHSGGNTRAEKAVKGGVVGRSQSERDAGPRSARLAPLTVTGPSGVEIKPPASKAFVQALATRAGQSFAPRHSSATSAGDSSEITSTDPAAHRTGMAHHAMASYLPFLDQPRPWELLQHPMPRVLVVDDEMSILQSMQKLLSVMCRSMNRGWSTSLRVDPDEAVLIRQWSSDGTCVIRPMSSGVMQREAVMADASATAMIMDTRTGIPGGAAEYAGGLAASSPLVGSGIKPIAAGSENAITDRQRRKAERAASRASRLKGRNDKQRERLLAELRAEALPSVTRADVIRHPYLGRRFAGKLVVDLAADGKAAVAAHRTLLGSSPSSPAAAESGARMASSAQLAQSFETADFWDMVIMDIRMPVMQGPAAVRSLRTQGYTGVILGHTGNAVDRDLRHMVDSGADACIHKPAVASIIESHLQAALLRRRGQSAARIPQ